MTTHDTGRVKRGVFFPLRELFPGDAIGGVLLILCAVIAMAWANAPFAASYFNLLHTEVPLTLGPVHLKLSVLHWINDLLMAVFFLVVGLEIKREMLSGELNDPKRATLPIAGALGGMLVPALIYTAFNFGTEAGHGWGIPMATDIAFSLGILSLLGPRVPRGITVFLAALAIADDLGAVIVIAIFYTRGLNLGALWVALGLFLLLVALARAKVMRLSVYLAVAPFLWYFMHESGVHATIAGVLLGFAVPLGKAGDPNFSDSPLESLEHALKPWVTWLVMPVFALANAGVAMGGMTIASLAHPISAGVGLGLLIGKPIGIVGLSWILVRFGIAKLPRAAHWGHMLGVGMLAGIGFTVALFVASLSFRGHDLEDLAKIGVLAGSTVSALLGSWVMSAVLSRDARNESRTTASAAVLLALVLAAGTIVPASRTSAAPADTLEARVLADREDTRKSFHEGATSPLATIERKNFPAEGGWLSLGSAPDNDVVLADSTVAGHHLRVKVEGKGFRVEATDPASSFTAGGEEKHDAVVGPSTIGVGRYRVRLSYQNAPAVIVFDPAKSAASTFKGPWWSPYDARWRFETALVRAAHPDTAKIGSTNGVARPALRVGRFDLRTPEGKKFSLAAYRLLEPGVSDTDVGLFFMDRTNGESSYHGGRYLDVESLGGDRYRLDFNACYNPSCAYSPHYNCPIPPKENRLSIGIPVGESWPKEASH